MSQASYSILVLCLALLAHKNLTTASGVFELELLGLEQFETNLMPKQISASVNPTKINICLKEAFTSQLDGPCPFGNATIAINRSSNKQEPATINKEELASPVNLTIYSNETTTRESHGHKSRHKPPDDNHKQNFKHQGSSLTNLVRILFTFRWTKSFTIILTAEDIQMEEPNEARKPQNSAHQEAMALVLARGNQRLGPIESNNPNETNRAIDKLQLDEQINHQMKGNKFIDRHVLTENEVLPNLELNPAKPWASRFSRTLKSSLSYKFRVYCSLNYYGDGCTTFCRPRDDQFGHYNCSSSGQKICLDGWTGAECDRAKCRSGCNLQHGFCDKPDTCQCRAGWTGSRCDECITYPGCQNGYCLNSWQCICHRNWGGVLCDQDLNYCGTHEPCKNNGTCQNIAPGKYKCHCPDGFSGQDCDAPLASMLPKPMTQPSAGCALNPCLNGGICYEFNSQFASDTALESSEVEAPANNALMLDRLHRCQCPSGYTGDYCQWSDTFTLPFNISIEPTNSSSAIATVSIESATLMDTEVPTSDNQTIDTFLGLSSFHNPISKEGSHTSQGTHLSMSHLISGVVIASVVGVFLASLLLAWTCLVMIERNKLSFIQMNVVRGDHNPEGGVSSALRHVHHKIRDSFRLSYRNRVIPGSKLNIDNVLGQPKIPPPSYEESRRNYINCSTIEYPPKVYLPQAKGESTIVTISGDKRNPENLVTRGAIAQKLATIKTCKEKSPVDKRSTSYPVNVQPKCPIHGHVYKDRTTNHEGRDL